MRRTYLSKRGRIERGRVRIHPISTMVKASGLTRLLLVALVLIVCRNHLVGAQEFKEFNVSAEPAADSVTGATIGGYGVRRSLSNHGCHQTPAVGTTHPQHIFGSSLMVPPSAMLPTGETWPPLQGM